MIPRLAVKLLLSYNVKPDMEEVYYHFIVNEFLPKLQNIGLLMVEGWYTAYGEYPTRLMGFVSESEQAMRGALENEEWLAMEKKLLEHVTDYEKRVVLFRNTFQFFRPSS